MSQSFTTYDMEKPFGDMDTEDYEEPLNIISGNYQQNMFHTTKKHFSFFKQCKQFIKFILFNYTIPKETKEEILHNYIKYTCNNKNAEQRLYEYIQQLQPIQSLYSGIPHIDMERFYQGDSLPFEIKTRKQLDDELDSYKSKSKYYSNLNPNAQPFKPETKIDFSAFQNNNTFSGFFTDIPYFPVQKQSEEDDETYWNTYFTPNDGEEEPLWLNP